MQKTVIAIAAALLAGIAAGAWLSGDRGAVETSEIETADDMPADTSGQLRRLEELLLEEREARIALEETVGMLMDELNSGGRADESAAVVREARRAAGEEVRQEPRSRDRSNWMQHYNESRIERMVEGGFTEEEARHLIEQESAASYQAMRAAWEAERNGEPVDPFASWNDPQRILRDSVGDDAYERYLKTQGQPTSVEVTQVMSQSPGDRVGLQPGDRISRYNGERVFSISDLRSLTMQGSPGESVVVEIVRDGMLMQLTLPAGPIGITGTGARTRGMNWWGG
jgi:hypothetical protein